VEKRVNYFSSVEEMGNRSDGWRWRRWEDARLQIGPRSGNQRATAIWKDYGEVQNVLAVCPAEKFQGLTLQGVVITSDGYFRGKTLEVGSVSCLPLTALTMSLCYGR
jgi:hypothetical protein